MSSGIIFHGYDHHGSNGLVEYILDLCVGEFDKVEECHPKVGMRMFFKDNRERFFGGLNVLLDDEIIKTPSDAMYLSYIFERVFLLAQQPDSELEEHGRATVANNFVPLVERLRKYADGNLSHHIQGS